MKFNIQSSNNPENNTDINQYLTEYYNTKIKQLIESIKEQCIENSNDITDLQNNLTTLINYTDSMFTTINDQFGFVNNRIEDVEGDVEENTADITALQNKTEYDVSEINPSYIDFNNYASITGSGVVITPTSIWINGIWITNTADTENYVSKYISIGDVVITPSTERTDLAGTGIHIGDYNINNLTANSITTASLTTDTITTTDDISVGGDATITGSVSANDITSHESTTDISKANTFNYKYTFDVEPIPSGKTLWYRVADFDGVYSLRMSNGSSIAITKHKDYLEANYHKVEETDIIGFAKAGNYIYLELGRSGKFDIGYIGYDISSELPSATTQFLDEGTTPTADWYRALEKNTCKYILGTTDRTQWGEIGTHISGVFSADGMEMPPITDIVVTDRLTVEGTAYINNEEVTTSKIDSLEADEVSIAKEHYSNETEIEQGSWFKLPIVHTGALKAQSEEWALNIQFADIDNATVQYSQTAWSPTDPAYLDNVFYIYEGALYFHTLCNANLLWKYESSELDEDSDITVYTEGLPFDISEAEEFEINAKQGTVFTRSTNAGGGSNKTLTLNPTTYEDSDKEQKVYNGSEDISHNYYAPNQSVDTTEEPTFNTINITEGTTTDTVVRSDENGRLYRQEPAEFNNGVINPEDKLVTAKDLATYNGGSYSERTIVNSGNFYAIKAGNEEEPYVSINDSIPYTLKGSVERVQGCGDYVNKQLKVEEELPEELSTIMPITDSSTIDWTSFTKIDSKTITNKTKTFHTGETIAFSVFDSNIGLITHSGTNYVYPYLYQMDITYDTSTNTETKTKRKFNNGNTSWNEYYEGLNNHFTDFSNPCDFTVLKNYLNADVGLVHQYVIRSNGGGQYMVLDHYPTLSEIEQAGGTIVLQRKVYNNSQLQDIIDDIHYGTLTFDSTYEMTADRMNVINDTMIAVTLYHDTDVLDGVPEPSGSDKNNGIIPTNADEYKTIVGTATWELWQKEFSKNINTIVSWANKKPDSVLSSEVANTQIYNWNGHILATYGADNPLNPTLPTFYEFNSYVYARGRIDSTINPASITIWYDANGDYDASRSSTLDEVNPPATVNEFIAQISHSNKYTKESHKEIDPSTPSYPITHLGNNTEVHGDLTVDGSTNIGGTLHLGNESSTSDLYVSGEIYKYDSEEEQWNSLSDTFIPVEEKGTAEGVATLDENTLVPTTQLPIATDQDIGAVKEGDGISIDEYGTIDVVDRLTEVSTMPLPTEDLEDAMRLYTGATTIDYKNGGIYQCKEITPSTSPKTYHWVLVSSANLQAGDGIDLTNDVISVINRLTEVDVLPAIDPAILNKTVLLKEAQTGYKKGGIYQEQANAVTPVGDEDPSALGWYEYDSVADEYILSEDVSVDTQKTYYAITWVLISTSELVAGDGIDITNDTISVTDRIPQYAIMPSATSELLGKVVEYIGATTASYTHNFFYECTEDSGVYSWEPTDVQKHNIAGWNTLGEVMPDMISIKADNDGEIHVVNRLVETTVMPNMDTTEIGRETLLLTQDQTGYKKGGIYQSASELQTPTGTENPYEEGWYEYDDVADVYSPTYDTTVDSGKDYYRLYWDLISTSNIQAGDGIDITNDTISVVDRLVETDTMPLPTATLEDEVRLYTGATTVNYKNGGIYQCKEVLPSTDPKTYEWEMISAPNLDFDSDNFDVADDTVSLKDGYKKIFTGTHAEWDELTLEEKKSYDEADFTDDVASGFPVISDVVADGDENPVTSNAVYNHNKIYTLQLNDITINANSMYSVQLSTYNIPASSSKPWIAFVYNRTNIAPVLVGDGGTLLLYNFTSSDMTGSCSIAIMVTD